MPWSAQIPQANNSGYLRIKSDDVTDVAEKIFSIKNQPGVFFKYDPINEAYIWHYDLAKPLLLPYLKGKFGMGFYPITDEGLGAYAIDINGTKYIISVDNVDPNGTIVCETV